MGTSHFNQRFVSKSTSFLVFGMGILSIVVTAVLYSRLPETVAVHWNLRGEPDRHASRGLVWLIGSIPLLIAVGMHFLPRIDPRQANYRKSLRAYGATMTAIVATLMVVQFVILANALDMAIRVDTIVKVTVGVLFIVLGNYLGTVRSTFFFGIRTPWTLSDDEVWRRTHRLGGKLFVGAGLVLVATAFTTGVLGVFVAVASLIAATVVPIVYSYVLYQRYQTRQDE